MRNLLVATLLCAAASAPVSAEAQGVSLEGEDIAFGLLGVAGVALAAVDVILIVEGADKAAQDGHGLYISGAGLEIALGSLQVAGGLGLIIWGIAEPYPGGHPDPAFAFGIPVTLVGAYLLGHGIWSVGDGRPHDAALTSAVILPTEGGAALRLGGRF